MPSGGGDPLPNQLAIAEARSTQVVFTCESVALSGANSVDPDSQIVSYSWKQISVSSVTLNNANQVTTTFKAPRVKRNSVKELFFELTVTDDKGATATDTVKVSVIR